MALKIALHLMNIQSLTMSYVKSFKALDSLLADSSTDNNLKSWFDESAYQGLNVDEIRKEVVRLGKDGNKAFDLLLLLRVTYERGTDTIRLTGREDEEARKALPQGNITFRRWVHQVLFAI